MHRLGFFLFLLTTGFVLGQTHTPKKSVVLDQIIRELKLSPEQRHRVHPVLQEMMAQSQALFEKYNDPEDKTPVDRLTEDKAEQRLNRFLQFSQERTELRLRNTQRLRSYLTSKQILKIYEVQNRLYRAKAQAKPVRRSACLSSNRDAYIASLLPVRKDLI